LCFNRVLADFLRAGIDPDDRLDVLTFHAWCERELRGANITMPRPPKRGRQWQEYWERVPLLLLEAYADGRAPAGAYQAILVDEGQDFADEWYRVILNALDPASNSLFITLDSSQNIYRRKVSWREIGVQIAGRSRVLRINYRNTRPILSAAYRIISQLDSSATAVRPQEEEFVIPDRALRSGSPPELHRHASRHASQRFALEWIRARLVRGIEPASILLLALGRIEVEKLAGWLERAGLPASLVAPNAPPGAVRLSTIHSAKGLDAGHVLLIGGHELEQRDGEEGRRLLYIAMTRAREELCVCYHGDSRLMTELEASIAETL
jgi:superfamily I DNA/RNA helicase